MKIDILTLFPEMFSPLEHSIVGKARERDSLRSTTIISVKMRRRHATSMMSPMVADKGCFYERSRSLMPFDAIEKKNPRVILLDPAVGLLTKPMLKN